MSYPKSGEETRVVARCYWCGDCRLHDSRPDASRRPAAPAQPPCAISSVPVRPRRVRPLMIITSLLVPTI